MAGGEDIAVRVGGDVSGLKKELKAGAQSLDKFRKGVNTGAKAAGKYAAAATAAGAAIATHIVKNTLAAVDAQAKLSRKIGTTVKELETLTRAGALAGVSINEIRNASLKLEVNAGKAEQGLLAQADAFKAMGLSASELLKLPLSERLLAVNSAINENVAATERAAVAADVFGAKNAAAIRLLDPETIRRAAEETELFGTALSEIDSIKVEQANDAISTMGLAMEGVSKQLTIKLAPILKAVGDEFKKTAKEGGGLGTIVSDSVDTAIKALGAVADVIAGVGRVASVITDTVGIAFVAMGKVIIDEFKDIVETVNQFPGSPLQGLETKLMVKSAQAEEIISAMKENINNTLLEPLPSAAFDKFIQDAQAAGQAAAEVAAEAKKAVNTERQDDQGLTTSESDALEKQQAQLDKLRESFKSETQLLMEKLENDQILIDQALIDKQITADEAAILEASALTAHQDKLTAIEEKAAQDRASAVEAENAKKARAVQQGISAIGLLLDTGNKKQFKANQKLGLADAAISMYQGIAAGLKLGWPLAIPAVAYAAATGIAQINNIKSQKFGGGASKSGGGPSSAANPAAATPAPTVNQQNISISGLNPNDLFSGQQVLGLLNQAIGDGGQLTVA